MTLESLLADIRAGRILPRPERPKRRRRKKPAPKWPPPELEFREPTEKQLTLFDLEDLPCDPF